MAEYNAKNGAALERLVKEQGVVVKEFNDDVYAAFKRGSDEVYAEVQAHSLLPKRSTTLVWRHVKPSETTCS